MKDMKLNNRRPWGSVKELISVLHNANMSMPEMACSANIDYSYIKKTCKSLKIKPRLASNPISPYYKK